MTESTLNKKEKILHAAWKLFLEKGYEDTTLNDILKESHTSRSGFYHLFHSKEELLFNMAVFFDTNYSDWFHRLETAENIADLLIEFDQYTSRLLEDSPYRSFLPQLYGYEVMSSGERYILSEKRPYYRLLLSFFQAGQMRGELSTRYSANALTHIYARIQRGAVYGWLLERCAFPLSDESNYHIKLFIDSLRI